MESPDNREALGYGAVTAIVQIRGCSLSRVVMAERTLKPQDSLGTEGGEEHDCQKYCANGIENCVRVCVCERETKELRLGT